MRSIGIMGGTFDPPHYGHLAAAEEVRYRLGLDLVVWVPAGTPPHKAASEVSPARDRLAMLEAAVAGNPCFRISRVELLREGPSYTVDTLRELGRQYSECRLVFIVGSDEFAALHTWHRPERLTEHAELAVMVRSGVEVDFDLTERAVPSIVGRYVRVPVPDLPMSSSDLRQRVREGLPIRYLVPDAVREYIEAHGLYRG